MPTRVNFIWSMLSTSRKDESLHKHDTTCTNCINIHQMRMSIYYDQSVDCSARTIKFCEYRKKKNVYILYGKIYVFFMFFFVYSLTNVILYILKIFGVLYQTIT